MDRTAHNKSSLIYNYIRSSSDNNYYIRSQMNLALRVHRSSKWNSIENEEPLHLKHKTGRRKHLVLYFDIAVPGRDPTRNLKDVQIMQTCCKDPAAVAANNLPVLHRVNIGLRTKTFKKQNKQNKKRKEKERVYEVAKGSKLYFNFQMSWGLIRYRGLKNIQKLLLLKSHSRYPLSSFSDLAMHI